MTAPVRPDTGSERIQRIRRNLARLKEQGAPMEVVQQYLDTERVTPEQELAAMPQTGAEKVGNAIRAAYQGASFNFGDELMGLVRGIEERVTGGQRPLGQAIAANIEDERTQLDRFRESNPKTSLALEIGGGIPTGLGAARALGAAGQLSRGGQLLATGAGGGAVAGVGAGESLEGRVALGAGGAAAGALIGKTLETIANSQTGQRVGRAITSTGQRIARAVTQRGAQAATAPVAGSASGAATAALPDVPVQTFADRKVAEAVLADGLPAAQQRLAELGPDALLLNAGGDQAARLARATMNAPFSEAGDILNPALAEQGGTLGRRVATDVANAAGITPGQSGAEVLQSMQDDLAAKVAPIYDAFRARGPLADDVLTLVGGDEDVAQRFGRYIAAVRSLDPDLAARPATDAQVVDEAFKLLQEEVRKAARGTSAVRERGTTNLRDRVITALGAIDPDYAAVTRQYALDDVGKVAQEAFETGRTFAANRTRGAGDIRVAKQDLPPQLQPLLGQGYATEVAEAANRRAPARALGDLAQFRDVARQVIGNVADEDALIEILGPTKYDELVAQLTPKIRAAAQNAAVRGNSTTARQLADAAALSNDAILDALQAIGTGNPQRVLLEAISRRVAAPAQAAASRIVGSRADDIARLLATRGPEATNLLQTLQQQLAAQAQRQAGAQAGAAIAVRPTADRF